MFSTVISSTGLELDQPKTELFYVSPISYLVATVFLALATLLAVPGNILVIFVVLKTPVLRSKAVNLLIVNLCVIDLISTWIDIPLMWSVLEFNHNRIKTIEWLCDCQLFFHAVSSSGQAFAFVSVGYERYHSIANPFNKEKTRYVTHLCIGFCWIISVIIGFIELFLVPDTITYEFCMMSKDFTGHLAMSYVIAPFGLICFVLIAFFYSRIIWLVRKHCKTANTTFRSPPVAGSSAINTEPSSISAQTPTSEIPTVFGEICVMDNKNRSIGRRRVEAETAKRSLYVIASFTIICLPYPLLVCIERVFNLINYKDIYQWQYCAHTMSSLSAGLNPLLYGLANKQFRTAFCRICRQYYKRYKDGVLLQ